MVENSDYCESPVGLLRIAEHSGKITAVSFCEERSGQIHPSDLTRQCVSQLEEYFQGKRQNFTLPLSPSGTPFQQNVWDKLQKIEYGITISYSELAIWLGDLKVIRAAGTANGKNPIAIIIPCHRVIGKNNSLVGYGGGLWRKEWLLKHEIKYSGNDHFFKI